jgi:hypothetical protein
MATGTMTPRRTTRHPSQVFLRLARVTAIIAVACVSLPTARAAGSGGSAGWSVHAVSEPESFDANDAGDRYQLLVENTGSEGSRGRVTLTDLLPAGITTQGTPEIGGRSPRETGWECTGATTVSCVWPETAGSILPGHYAPTIDIYVSSPAEGVTGVLTNTVTVQGGGLASASVVHSGQIGKPAVFEVNEFAFEPDMTGGVQAGQAGAHPWALTTSTGIPTADGPAKGGKGHGHLFTPPRTLKTVAVELPAGFLGDPLATERCRESQLQAGKCPPKSQVGVFGIILSESIEGEFTYSKDKNVSTCCSPVYNMVPAEGYPAEFAFTFAETVPTVMYANVVHTATGYRVRVVVPYVSTTTEPVEATLTFFGEPGLLNGSGSSAAFLSSPSDCSGESDGLSAGIPSTSGGLVSAAADSARVELSPWGPPGDFVSGETVGYSGLSGCAALVFYPRFGFGPAAKEEGGSSGVDEPSAYDASLTVPQTTGFSETATPPLRNSTVVLPAGVSASPSAATGLEGCAASGPEGINIGSGDLGPRDQDLGDPEATELGEGHAGPGGNSSPYDDGIYHTAPGHCPKGSVLGSVEVCTPLLANRANAKGEVLEGEAACEANAGIAPVSGHVFLGEPECGGAGQEACSDAFAEGKGGPDHDQSLVRMYIEVAGDGVIAKLPGTVTANPVSGQLTASFDQAPQLAFGDLKIHFNGGPRAPLANPQSCGMFTTSTVFEPWSHREANDSTGTPDATPSSSFAIGGCAPTTPFNPSVPRELRRGRLRRSRSNSLVKTGNRTLPGFPRRCLRGWWGRSQASPSAAKNRRTTDRVALEA